MRFVVPTWGSLEHRLTFVNYHQFLVFTFRRYLVVDSPMRHWSCSLFLVLKSCKFFSDPFYLFELFLNQRHKSHLLAFGRLTLGLGVPDDGHACSQHVKARVSLVHVLIYLSVHDVWVVAHQPFDFPGPGGRPYATPCSTHSALSGGHLIQVRHAYSLVQSGVELLP